MTDSVEVWTPEQVKSALDKGEIILIDVRNPQEYMLERIEGSLLAPMSHLKATSLPGEGDKKVVFHCGSGKRSEKAGKMCLENGLTSIAHMDGGMGAWKDRKLPYIGTDMATGLPKEMP